MLAEKRRMRGLEGKYRSAASYKATLHGGLSVFFKRKEEKQIDSPEYTRLHKELMDQERSISSLKSRIDDLEVKIQRIRGTVYRDKQIEEKETEKPENSYIGIPNPFK